MRKCIKFNIFGSDLQFILQNLFIITYKFIFCINKLCSLKEDEYYIIINTDLYMCISDVYIYYIIFYPAIEKKGIV
jgi:hypothetical protein